MDHCRALGMVPLQGPRRRLFLMSEVPLYGQVSDELKRHQESERKRKIQEEVGKHDFGHL